MKERSRFVWIALVVLLWLPGSPTPCATEQSTIEFAALIESFLVDEGETKTVFDWSWGSEAGSFVDWTTEVRERRDGAYERHGNFVVTVWGEDPESGSLVLRGTRAGFAIVEIQFADRDQTCGPSIDSVAEELSIEPYKCRDEPVFGSPVYTVTKAGKQQAWLVDLYSAGSGGCSRTLELVFDRARADQVECFADDMPPKTDWSQWAKEREQEAGGVAPETSEEPVGKQLGTLVSASGSELVIRSSEAGPPVGAAAKLSKHVTLPGGAMKLWVEIARVKVTATDGDRVTLEVIEERTVLTVNEQKHDHFTPGSKIRLVW